MRLLFDGPVRYVAGDEKPVLVAHVRDYPSDPQGLAVTFMLVRYWLDTIKSVTGTASKGNATSHTDNGVTTYDFDLTFTWAASDLTETGLFYARFRLEATGLQMSIPGDRSLTVEVVVAPA